jgi:hypothetical protein
MLEEDVMCDERVAWEELFPFMGRRGRTLPSPVDAYRDALCDEHARRMFDLVRSATNWVCYTCASAEVMALSARPRTDPYDGLDLVDALLTPAQFSHLARHALAQDQHVLVALRDYLTLVRDGRRDRAASLVGARAEDERESVASGAR